MTMDNNGNDFLLKIKQLSKILELKICKDLESIGITSQQGRVLFFIIKSNESGKKVKQKDIEEKYQLSKSTVSGLVKRLADRGFIIKTKDFSDIFLVPTEKSFKVINTVKENRDKIKQQLLGCISKREQLKLEKTLDRIIDKIKEESKVCGTK